MYKWLKKDFAYKVLAILLSLLLWFYVANVKNSVIEESVTTSVICTGLKNELVLSNKPEDVEIKIRGAHSIVEALTTADIKAYVDLSNAERGEDEYFINVVLPTGVEAVFTRPSSVKLRVDTVEVKNIPISVIIQGTAAEDYSSYEPVLEPSFIVVKGAGQLLDNLETALVTVNLNHARDNLVLNPPVTLLTKEGDSVSSEFDISPRNIQVFVPVAKPTDTKTVTIKPEIKGEPKEGLLIASVTLKPEAVKITGPNEILSEITQVSTAVIDITGIEEDYSTQIALVPPKGTNLLYQPTVQLVVKVEDAYVTKNITDIPLSVENLIEGYNYTVKPNSINIIIKGFKDEIENLDISTIKALVDVNELEVGTRSVEVKVDVPENIKIQKIDPSIVEVVISKEDEE
ncbi:MAG: CdaR family protein [Clostridia bacterium]|nr:CdaR family protein [Clostridia bacterium]MDD4048113.1 CdaR family protein [Clostridia bacterium]